MNLHGNRVYTQEQRDLAWELHLHGATYPEIAMGLWKNFGIRVTRCAIGGLIYRLKRQHPEIIEAKKEDPRITEAKKLFAEVKQGRVMGKVS